MAETVDWQETEATQQEQLNPVPPYSKFVAIRDFPGSLTFQLYCSISLLVYIFTGEAAHDLPFSIYPERVKTEVSRQQIVERLIDGRREKAESLRNEKVRKEN